jgi:hypothetical protein
VVTTQVVPTNPPWKVSEICLGMTGDGSISWMYCGRPWRMSQVEVVEDVCDTSLLGGPAGLWTAIDKAGFAKRTVQGRADPTGNQENKRV